jgi:hypothetical protein
MVMSELGRENLGRDVRRLSGRARISAQSPTTVSSRPPAWDSWHLAVAILDVVNEHVWTEKGCEFLLRCSTEYVVWRAEGRTLCPEMMEILCCTSHSLHGHLRNPSTGGSLRDDTAGLSQDS